jgi:hypothetical protein
MVERYKKLRLESFVSTLNSIVLAKLLVLETDFGFQRAGRSDGPSSPMPEYIDKFLAQHSFFATRWTQHFIQNSIVFKNGIEVHQSTGIVI